MEKDWMISNFDEIELKIENLIKVCATLENTNTKLEEEVKRLEEALQEKIETENLYVEQKAMVRERIDGLLMKLNDYSDHKE